MFGVCGRTLTFTLTDVSEASLPRVARAVVRAFLGLESASCAPRVSTRAAPGVHVYLAAKKRAVAPTSCSRLRVVCSLSR